MAHSKRSNIDEFIALPDSQKQRIFRQIDSESVEQSLALSRPLNAKERKQWRRFKVEDGPPKGR